MTVPDVTGMVFSDAERVLLQRRLRSVVVRRQRRLIMENLRVFFLFLRRRDVRAYLEANRDQIEQELTRITRLARRLDQMENKDSGHGTPSGD